MAKKSLTGEEANTARRYMIAGYQHGVLFLFYFYNYVFVVKGQETGWSASYGVNKTINNPTTGFTPSWEKSNHSKQENARPPNST